MPSAESTAGVCRHKGGRTELNDNTNRVRCDQCSVVFLPYARRPRVRHGTYSGYNKHRRLREAEGQWCWPPCEACAVGAKKWRAAHVPSAAAEKMRRSRQRAHARAILRMQRAFPQLYNSLYTEELKLEEGNKVPRFGPDVSMAVWDDVLRRLVKAATGMDEATLISRARGRIASGNEREVVRALLRLRTILGDLSKKTYLRPDLYPELNQRSDG